jgi:hypothetical protein
VSLRSLIGKIVLEVIADLAAVAFELGGLVRRVRALVAEYDAQ